MPIESPKSRFLKSEVAKRLADIVINKDVVASLDVALSQMTWDLSNSPDMGTAAANHFRLEGAKRLMLTWLTLPDVHRPAMKDKGDNLSEI